MSIHEIYKSLVEIANRDINDAREFLVSKVNVCDLNMLQGFADFDERSEIAFEIYTVRNAG